MVICLTVVNTLLLVLTYSHLQQIALKYGFIAQDPHFRTAFTSMFLHGGFWHLIGNMFFLWMFGGQAENRLGAVRFLLLYLACGLAGSGLHYLIDPTSKVPVIGASGAISGIVGAYYVFFPRARFDLDIYLGWWHITTIPTNTPAAVGAWFLEQFILGLITHAIGSSSVAFWAHVGGFLFGIGAAGILRLSFPDRSTYEPYGNF